jgi:hypothetical protein
MNIESAFPSKWLKAADLQGRTIRVTIRTVLMEAVGGGSDQKPILYFQGKERGVVLNRTNAVMIAHYYGQDTDQWPGREVELYTETVPFQGRMVSALRVRVPSGAPAPVRAPDPPPQTYRQPEPPPPTHAGGYGAMIDDEIPFGPIF